MSLRKHISKNEGRANPNGSGSQIFQTESMNGKSDLEIWKEFRQGDDRAFIHIYRSYSESMFNYGCQFTKQKDFVRDCIQDLFCELIDNNRKLGDVLSIKGYLFKCIKRKVLAGLKKKSKQELIDVNNAGFQIAIGPELVEITQTFDVDFCHSLQKAVNKLPLQQREVILLHFYEGLTYQEISEIIGIKVKSVRMQAYRAIQSLRQGLNASEFKLAVSLLLISS